jgi:hypothetical protein
MLTMLFMASTPSSAERPRSGAAAACAETPWKRNFADLFASELPGLASLRSPACQWSVALRQTMEGELERIFRLIALLAPAASLHDAYVGVRSTNSVVRANALEYLENVLKPGLREVLLPLIDGHVTERERATMAERIVGPPVESSEQAVAVLLASDDPWLRSRAEIMSNRAAEARTAEEEFAPRPTGIDSDMGAG